MYWQTSKIIAAAQSDFPTSPYASDGQQAAAAVAAALSKGAGKSNVIRAVIDKLWYPITVEVLYKVIWNSRNGCHLFICLSSYWR